MSSIDHVSIRVSDLGVSRRFYSAVLGALGFGQYSLYEPDGAGVGFGPSGVEFSIHEPIDDPGRDRVTTGAHIAFSARTSDEVDEFHRVAVALGARSIGEPGLRPHYSEGYYGAFVLDPDGNNIEVVNHNRG